MSTEVRFIVANDNKSPQKRCRPAKWYRAVRTAGGISITRTRYSVTINLHFLPCALSDEALKK